MRRRGWFKPVRGLGEWIGFLGGILVLLAVLAVVVLVVSANHVSIRVLNDTAGFVRISDCVDDAANVEAGDGFEAEGVAKHGRIVCRVTLGPDTEECVAVPVPSHEHATASLSRLLSAPPADCD